MYNDTAAAMVAPHHTIGRTAASGAHFVVILTMTRSYTTTVNSTPNVFAKEMLEAEGDLRQSSSNISGCKQGIESLTPDCTLPLDHLCCIWLQTQDNVSMIACL
jgi:hypothetical protein